MGKKLMKILVEFVLHPVLKTEIAEDGDEDGDEDEDEDGDGDGDHMYLRACASRISKIVIYLPNFSISFSHPYDRPLVQFQPKHGFKPDFTLPSPSCIFRVNIYQMLANH